MTPFPQINPSPPNDCRYAVGSVVAEGDNAVPDSNMLDKFFTEGFKIIHLPKPDYVVVASFPFRTTISIYLAIWKVYPKLKKYIASNSLCAYPAIEYYDDSSIHVRRS